MEQRGDGDEPNGHEGGGAVEGGAPGDLAKQAAGKRADGEADAHSGLIQNDRLPGAAGGCADDGSERGGDKQRVAQAPARTEADDRVHRARRAGEEGENHDKREPDQKRDLDPDAGGNECAEEHCERCNQQVASKQQHRLRRRRVQLSTNRRQDRVDEPDAHERDGAGKGERPDGDGLVQDGVWFFVVQERDLLVGLLAVGG